MKVAKLVAGIVSIVISAVVGIISLIVGILNLVNSTGQFNGSVGGVVAVCMLVGGIVGLATRKGRVGGIVAACFFGFGALVGMEFCGSFISLRIWSYLAFAFCALFFLASVIHTDE